MCKVTVIIPTYNRAYCIERAIISVLEQEYKNFELLIIDDASTDNTFKVIVSYLSKDERIKYIVSPSQRGVSAARNLGIKNSKGDLIAFLDSDDEWLSNKLMCQMKLYNNEKYNLCHTDEIWVRNGVRVNPMKKHKKYGGDIFEKCLPLCCISPSAVIIKKEIFEIVGLFDESLEVCEDYDFWLRFTSRYSVSYIDELLIKKYGGHEDQLSRKSWGNDEYRIIALEKIIKSGFLSEHYKDAAIKTFKEKCIILSKGFAKHSHLDKSIYYKELALSYI